jgi:hypothetical protein
MNERLRALLDLNGTPGGAMIDSKETPHIPVERPDEHRAGVVVGAVSGSVMGALAGASAGPMGAATGAALGGVIGGAVGHSAAKSVDATMENNHWEEAFKSAPYADPSLKYADYAPAYRFGWESYDRYAGRNFDDIQFELMHDWDAHRSDSPLTWEKAKAATRDAWDRVGRFARKDAATDGSPDRPAYETNATLDQGVK